MHFTISDRIWTIPRIVFMAKKIVELEECASLVYSREANPNEFRVLRSRTEKTKTTYLSIMLQNIYFAQIIIHGE